MILSTSCLPACAREGICGGQSRLLYLCGTYISYSMEGLSTTWILDNFDAYRDLNRVSFWNPDPLERRKTGDD